MSHKTVWMSQVRIHRRGDGDEYSSQIEKTIEMRNASEMATFCIVLNGPADIF